MKTVALILLCYLIYGIVSAVNSIADPVKIVAVEKHHDDGFGFTVALSGDFAIVAAPRVGISEAKDVPWRFLMQ